MTPAASDITFGVSLYSYGGDFLVTMSLEDCLADVADMGATDLEILADTHIRRLSDTFDRVGRRLARAPRAPRPRADVLLELARHAALPGPRPHRGRGGGDPDARPRARAPARVHASLRPKLGVVSLDLVPDPIWRETVKRVLPTAEKYDIRIAPEIHAPTPLRSTIVEDYVDLVRETGTRHFGLLIDTGIFQTGERTGSHSDSVFVFGSPEPELRERVAREMSKPMAVDPADLVDLMPYVVHVHAKFWDMNDDLTDPHVPYDAIVKTLVDGGYTGSLSSEYEGPRDLYRASDMLRRQQAMLRSLVAAG